MMGQMSNTNHIKIVMQPDEFQMDDTKAELFHEIQPKSDGGGGGWVVRWC